MQDFPAAHSMDTDWFAVDAEGYVGFFKSSENGAVPSSIRRSCLYIDEFIDILPSDSRGIIHLPIDGNMVANRASLESLWEDISYGNTTYDLLLFLSSENVIEEFMPYVRLRFSGSDTVVYVEECSTGKIQNLIESGKIIKGKPWFCIFENAYLLGLFPYRHDLTIPAPYKRLGIPTYPLKFDDLPSEFQRKMGNVRFDSIRFMEAKEIQPIEHTPCNTWGGTPYWLDTKREREEWQRVMVKNEDFLE